jgi:gamma-glutamyltranspeptidase
MDRMDWTGASPRNPKYIDTFCRVMQQVYPDERRAAGDVPDSPQRVAKLLDEASIDKLVKTAQTADPHSPYQAKPAAALLNEPDRLADSRFNQAPMGDESEMASTTHLVIIDKMGNVACCTQSLGLHFGSQVVAAGTGVLLNADESNFSFGNAKSINAFAPGKWPRSTMSPTLFFKDDKPYLVIGSPAGARIPNLVLQVSLDVLKFGTPLKSAIEAPRFHIVAAAGKSDAPNHIDIEPEMPADLEGSLEKLGWSVKRRMQHDFYFGSVNAALIQGDRIAGVADQRRTADAGGD